jgi:2-polyprenyl-3-methyl-5-hydroxy-6-metoxy-1,4-benzoquinol methylase
MIDLRHRSATAERMDTDCVDFDDYQHCLADLARVNVVTLTHRPVLAWLSKEASDLPSFSLLDVGCGHGDLLRRVEHWARHRGVSARLEGVDQHPWSIRAARAAMPENSAIGLRAGDIFAYEPDEPFDFIVSSQFTHHLTNGDLIAFLRWQERNARRGWFVADLRRHWFAYYGFPLLARLARWHHFVRTDGQISIARSFTAQDWRTLLALAGIQGDVEIASQIPFRLCVARRCHR